MRSAPTTTRLTPPRRMSCATIESVMSVTSKPSFASSHAVRRAPCRTGRVSQATTRTRLPASRAARTTPSAVPYPPVASAPALQCVRIVAPSGTRAAPIAPIALHAATSSR